jgi:hypothetical protein
MWPVDPPSEESPSEMLLPRRETMARAMATPTVVAIATPAMKEAESFTGLEAVRKMIADIIWGPAIIVMARGRIVRFMALVLAFLQRLAQAGVVVDVGRQYRVGMS